LITYVVNENLNYMEITIITSVEHCIVNLYFNTHKLILIPQFIRFYLHIECYLNEKTFHHT